MGVKTRYCDECTQWDPRPGQDRPACLLGHRLRCYAPRGIDDRTWGWKRRCEDFCPVATAPEK